MRTLKLVFYNTTKESTKLDQDDEILEQDERVLHFFHVTNLVTKIFMRSM